MEIYFIEKCLIINHNQFYVKNVLSKPDFVSIVKVHI